MPILAQATGERGYTRGEELANTVSAATGLIVFAAASPFVLWAAMRSGQPWAVPSTAIFLGSMVGLYFTSTLYHALPSGRTKSFVRLLDHSAIFVLIAGTYTPFALGPLAASGGVPLVITQWILATIGIAFKFAGGIHYRHLSNLFYLAMGWLGIFWIGPFLEKIPWEGFVWVLAGGVAYSAGVPFYAAKRGHYTHLIWHLFILAGSLCHTIAVWKYAL